MSLLTFRLNYHTTWGQQVCLCGSHPELGNFNEAEAIELSHEGDDWFTQVNIPQTTNLQYYYFIRYGGNTIRREWGQPRKLHCLKSRKLFRIRDYWKDRPFHSYLYSSVFTESPFLHGKCSLPTRYHNQSLLLQVICPYVGRRERLVVSGSCEALGNWDLKKACPLVCTNDGEWQILLDTSRLPEQTDYKFVIVDEATGEAVHWEDGENRSFRIEEAHREPSVMVEGGVLFQYLNFSYKGVGTAIPVFSLRTDESFGVGDFADLRKMIDWAAVTGQQLIQLLPVNDTTTTKSWRDSYPYSAISIYALHPIYLGCGDYPLKSKKKQQAYRAAARKLNLLPELDYEEVLKLKDDYCRELFTQEGKVLLASEEYHTFYEKNSRWLFPYACYCYLRDQNGSADFRSWGTFARYDEQRLQQMLEESPEALREINYYCFMQFLLHRQFSGVKSYAHEKGIVLKGDIPIGISRDSIDAWATPHLFNMDTQSGAPPDDFSFFGQNWGFPTYNWYAMEKEGYAWWMGRFRKMADYFDAYRIDHILGFFRIWEIPLDAVQGLLGHFSPALPYWAEELNYAGIPFSEERMVEPFIHESFLPELFGSYVDEVKEDYLDVSGWQRFTLKPFCNTQRKIMHLFEHPADERCRRIRDGLMSLSTEVLFIRDLDDRNRYHPRITAQYTHSYQYLDDAAKGAFNRLYDDFFYHRHNYFWREQAMKKLPALISSTSMMVCGEDLGMVPDCVPSVMQELQIFSLEIQRMPKDPKVLFTDLQRLPYLSVCTTSTHDMSPLRLWWTENREVTQRYYNEVLHHEGAAPEACTPQLCEEIVRNHLQSSAAWVILPWQDWMSLDERLCHPSPASERINIPANPEHYWRYRMHLSLDDLLKETAFNEKIAAMSRR